MVVGLKADLGQFLHCMCCAAEQLSQLRSCSAEGWGLLKLVLSPECVLKLHFLWDFQVAGVLRDDPDSS